MRKAKMKPEQQRESVSNPGSTYKIFSLALLPGLITIFLLIAAPKGAESKKFTSKFLTLENLNLIYNQIDASNFPRIVSFVSVRNQQGFVIGKLDENNFEVHEDNVREHPIDVVELTIDSLGIDALLLIDCSKSMKYNLLDMAKATAGAFVDLMQKRDRAAVVSLAMQPRLEYPFTGNIDSLKAVISRLQLMKGTSMYDALIYCVSLMDNSLRNRAIILITDGVDEDSQHTYEEALNALISNEVRVFTIGIKVKQNSSTENFLKDLANKTDGLYFNEPTSSELEEIYQALRKSLYPRYRVSYTTHNPAKDGTLRHVRIDVMVNTSTSWDTASYRAPLEEQPVDTLDPVDPIDPIDPQPEEPAFEVLPNPFTPNDDGFNDWAEFRKGDNIPPDWSITIMDRTGKLIRRLVNGEYSWDGKDKSGKLMVPGCYLYFVSNGNQILYRGLIQLIL
jgi:VWFA-related protein